MGIKLKLHSIILTMSAAPF